MNCLIVINPLTKQKGEMALKEIIQLCSRNNFAYDIYSTTGSFESDLDSLKKYTKTISRIIVIGGDGLINLVANAVVNSDIEIMIIPKGTGNDFSRTLYSSKKCDINKLFKSNASCFDLIKINERYCVNVAGVGFDTYLLSKMNRRLKITFGSLAYVITALRCLFSYKSQSIEIHENGKWNSLEPLLLVFALGRYFGGGMQINPVQKTNEVTGFNVIKCEQKGLLITLKSLLYLLFSQHFRLSYISKYFSKTIKIRANTPLILDVDGELVEYQKNEIISLSYIQDAIKIIQIK